MKNILITGASGNLGKAILAAFEKESEFHINITSREEIHGSDHLKAFYVDLMNEASSAALVNEIIENQQHLDAVVFLTGAYIAGDITHATSPDIQKMIGVNVATAHNIAAPLMQINRDQKKPLHFIFIGAKAAMDPASAVTNVAYALSKKMLFHYSELINETENKYGTLAHIILPGTLNTAFNRESMPDADFSTWTNPDDIAHCIKQIVLGEQVEKVISI
jgi:NAD(P)-dependent dehydrogenase (short-subunit alcohol dehydrogenase family)